MSRLTYSQGYAVNLKGMPTDVTCEEYCANIPCGNGCDGCLIDKAICKLAHYEDLEDEGRLIELPCLPNEEVWESHKRFGTHKTMYASREAIVGAIEAGYVIGYTKEEAEEKLAEMECAE